MMKHLNCSRVKVSIRRGYQQEKGTLMENVYSIQHICLLLASAVVFIAGLLIHSFIIAVNIADCWNRRPMTSADQIIFSIGFSRLILQVSSLGDLCFTIIYQSLFRLLIIHEAMKFFFHLSNISSFWFSALLSIVFYLKISNFNNVFFLQLKNFILQKVVHLIFTCLLFSGPYTVVGVWWYHNEVVSLDMKIKMNITENIQLGSDFHIYFITGNAVPFMVSFISTILVVRNLCLHLSRMRGNNNITAHLDTYYIAIKSTASCFVSYTLHIISTNIIMTFYFSMDMVGVFCIDNIFPAVHSAYLIFITTRLRNQFSRFVHHGGRCLFNIESHKQIERINGQNGQGMEEPAKCNENIPMS
ncbi:taste receptor type 2 member 50-like [Hyla sarda]|uniref:taste receptor type 2 member 50-like n=1 Tax=Hyla sarda TaxID=327740 RepID=UPI0024C27E4A|nr:taste receptor type 2 member 50-like [Hyla sarda]